MRVLIAALALVVASPAAAEPYPERYLDRPLILTPGGVLATLAVTGAASEPEASALAVAAVGLVPRLEATLLYEPNLSPLALDTALTPGLGYSVFGTATFEIDVRALLPLELGGGDVLGDLAVGPVVWWTVSERVAVYTLDTLVYVDLGGDGAVLPIDANVGYQLTPKVWLALQTYLATIAFGEGETTTVADVTPLWLQGLYVLNASFDVGLNVGCGDLQAAADSVYAGVFATFKK